MSLDGETRTAKTYAWTAAAEMHHAAAVDEPAVVESGVRRRAKFRYNLILFFIVLLDVDFVVTFCQIYADIERNNGRVRPSLRFIAVVAVCGFGLTKLLGWLLFIDSLGRHVPYRALRGSIILVVWLALGSMLTIVLGLSREKIIFEALLQVSVILSFNVAGLLYYSVNSPTRRQTDSCGLFSCCSSTSRSSTRRSEFHDTATVYI